MGGRPWYREAAVAACEPARGSRGGPLATTPWRRPARAATASGAGGPGSPLPARSACRRCGRAGGRRGVVPSAACGAPRRPAPAPSRSVRRALRGAAVHVSVAPRRRSTARALVRTASGPGSRCAGRRGGRAAGQRPRTARPAGRLATRGGAPVGGPVVRSRPPRRAAGRRPDRCDGSGGVDAVRRQGRTGPPPAAAGRRDGAARPRRRRW